ncbi:predicted protein [Naegleria gruberi]|uniref:Predicted protein n=1 Tax=Naegleria gruberi TaxID=5762 RepID=D2VY75_NAEGR|nr:uncharacterized protein NAEGRDRAFT_74016 [Naegleria gruberi]EFC38151.1 predicted protein [Naegleria gruberi]|eukprot:XP_002670895.1 predicted protein [Naegleria gruberi strain NEG-M]
MNPNKQSNRRKSKALKLTVVDFCSSNPTSTRRSNNDDVVDDNCKVMTSKYTEYFSNNSKPFQVISFPFKPSNTCSSGIQKQPKKKRIESHHDDQFGKIQFGNNNTVCSGGGGDDSVVASLHQDRIEESSSNDQQQPSTPTLIQSLPSMDKKRQRRTSITIRELLNYDD